MKTMLESYGLSVVTAQDGHAGVEIAKFIQPDLIVLDNKMPKMTGQEAAKIIRGAPETKGVPIIMVSAMEPDQSMIEYIKMGENYFLKKPFTTDTLLEQIEEMIGRPVRKEKDTAGRKEKIPVIIVALREDESVDAVTRAFGENKKLIRAESAEDVLTRIEKGKPELAVVNYVTAGLGSKTGFKLLCAALIREVPLLLDMADILKPESARKLLDINRRYYLLTPESNSVIEQHIKSMLLKLDFF